MVYFHDKLTGHLQFLLLQKCKSTVRNKPLSDYKQKYIPILCQYFRCYKCK